MTNAFCKKEAQPFLLPGAPPAHPVPCPRTAIFGALSSKLNKDGYQQQILSTSMLQNLVTVQNGPRKINNPRNDGVCKY